jgi:hypothetical protein
VRQGFADALFLTMIFTRHRIFENKDRKVSDSEFRQHESYHLFSVKRNQIISRPFVRPDIIIPGMIGKSGFNT